ncbi:reduced folate carrier domain-containing protein [Ditylenchus destructor]|uniref:Reduced folate carrier domain-containing protein n=1 Tax=Ditylenchus destructor TaxID=166010 RepID=A0AAD4NFW6_9BILA|nr:reduced folate carrier domain-containing protein [Ditylenchus destructor]
MDTEVKNAKIKTYSNGSQRQDHMDDDNKSQEDNNFSTKKKQSLSISANEWRDRVKSACVKKRQWWLPALLCFYAILKEIKVGEPYMYKYQTEYLNLTAEQLTGEVYPVNPYTYLISLVPIFLLTDLLLYKPTMITEVTGQIVFRATLVFGGSVFSQVIGQVFYGIASASEVAFFSYIYARLEKDQYRKLTSWTRAGTMAGRTFGYLFSQFLILSHLGNLRTLNIIAFIMPCLVFIVCVLLPRVHWKIMVGRMLEAKGREIKSNSSPTTRQLPKTYSSYLLYRIRKLRSDFIKIYSIGFIRKWSLWWAMTTCMSLQVALFAQTLWGEVHTGDSPLNGFAEASYTATATLAILAMNAFPLNWDKWGELALVIISSVDAVMLIIYSQAQNIYVMYACYIGYRSLYQVMITIAQWNIAKKMVCESYGLVFGTNSFIALIMQSILTVIVTDKRGLALHVRQQYLIYAGLHMAIATIFLCSVIYTVMNYLCRSSKVADEKLATTCDEPQNSDSESGESEKDMEKQHKIADGVDV